MIASLPLLLALTALPLLAAAKTPARKDAKEGHAGDKRVPFVYVGGYRPEISIFRLNVASGKLTPAGSAEGGKDPSFLAWDAQGHYLFAVNEIPDGRVASFTIDQKTGALARIGDTSSAGVGPAHVSVDPSGRWVLVANYADPKPGTIAVIPVAADGKLGNAVDTRDFGPASMPHSIRTDPTGKFVFVPCKGGPYVAQFKLDGRGHLQANKPERVPSAPKAGPRHMDFHPNGRFAYVINEQGMTITTYAFDAATGRLDEIESVPTLPAGVTGGKDFSTADIHVHPSGTLLYGSNRGHNSIVIFRVDPATGKLTLIGHETRSIDKPRNFNIDPSGTLLMVANQASASVTMFRIDQESGKLELLGAPTPVGPKPSFVGVLMLPGK
jgi:6-phosphogluconolactonase